jgi:hypothetical protein
MIKKTSLLFILVIEIWVAKFWLICSSFVDFFHFSSIDMHLKLDDLINNDKGFSTLSVRFFHNKIAFFVQEVFSSYLRFWDIRFGVVFFSIVGYFGILCGFWYLIKSRTRYRWLIVAIFLLLPFLEIFRLIPSFQISFIILAGSYDVLSLYGILGFVRSYKRLGLLLIAILMLISIWYIHALPLEMFLNCLKK